MDRYNKRDLVELGFGFCQLLTGEIEVSWPYWSGRGKFIPLEKIRVGLRNQGSEVYVVSPAKGSFRLSYSYLVNFSAKGIGYHRIKIMFSSRGSGLSRLLSVGEHVVLQTRLLASAIDVARLMAKREREKLAQSTGDKDGT